MTLTFVNLDFVGKFHIFIYIRTKTSFLRRVYTGFFKTMRANLNFHRVCTADLIWLCCEAIETCLKLNGYSRLHTDVCVSVQGTYKTVVGGVHSMSFTLCILDFLCGTNCLKIVIWSALRVFRIWKYFYAVSEQIQATGFSSFSRKYILRFLKIFFNYLYFFAAQYIKNTTHFFLCIHLLFTCTWTHTHIRSFSSR